MSDKKEDKSFWTTLPGILTGCAALITAIGTLGALITALYTVGPFKPSSPTTSMVVETAATHKPTEASGPAEAPKPTTAPPTFAPTTIPPTIPQAPTVVPTSTPGIGASKISADGATMVYVPAGDFTMGSNDGNSNEKPVHTVYLDGFWIDKFEVTNILYKKCVDAGKCQRPSETSSEKRSSYYGNATFDSYPVIFVSSIDASAFCAWANKRLPTEAQWEKAARGTDGRIYPWGNSLNKNLLNSIEGGLRDTTAVGSYPGGASPYGAMDMAGNVWEWVADWYAENYYSISPRNNPQGPSLTQERIIRGGSWRGGFDTRGIYNYMRAAFRYNIDPGTKTDAIGFRCVE